MLRLPRSLHFEVHKVPCLPRRLRGNLHIKLHCEGVSQQKHFQRQHQDANTPLSLDTSPEVSKRTPCPNSMIHATKSERTEDHHRVQSAAPATKSAHRRKPVPISCACHEKLTLNHKNHKVSLVPATTSDRQVQKCARHHNESAVEESTRAS